MIRSYNIQDTDRVIRIWLEASILAHHFIPAMYWIEKQEDMRNIYLPGSNTYVFEDEKTKSIQGFVSMVDNYLAAIFVIPEAQGAGIGKALMKYVKDVYTEMTLRVYAKNESAVAFYEKQTFRFVEEHVEEETGEHEFVMKWNR
ncbi:N-acetyltransferase [Bacteroides sp.]|uniref:N-acetyltransferase n=1 Tax=Bacteroides sp. TaxID=29523 RepID=UPI0025B86AD0|nr:N-acetyltransferase [Bacteroides sp.]